MERTIERFLPMRALLRCGEILSVDASQRKPIKTECLMPIATGTRQFAFVAFTSEMTFRGLFPDCRLTAANPFGVSPMVFSSPRIKWLFVLVWTLGIATSFPAVAQDSDPEEAREAAIIARFVTVLEKNPRRGTALDKVYGFHVERGSLDGLIKNYREKTTKSKGPEAAGAWMIIGLMESLRGQDAASVEAFEKAEQLDTASYLASYYLGQALVLIGQPDKAAEAFERSIQRKPAQADQLDIFQSLGRVYQRAQKNDKALEVWNRLEKQFPNDARVQEQIATTLLEENEFAAALPRFQNLAKTTKDKYRQSLFQMEAAEINVRLGKSAEAIKEFEQLLGQLNPDNWLFREVRRRIENVYLRTDDQAGLIAYYEAWTKKNPEDLEAISRLARLLSGLGRGPEAQAWLEKGLKAAPSRKELRNALIAQLIYEQKFPEAILQYEQLDKYEPNNPDTLREWGRLILKDTKRDEATRKADAAVVWRRLTTGKPKDPLIASQVAELFRQAEMVDEALALYRQSIELAPDAAQYKEYLGEYFHSLQRKDDALATWRQMAEGKARTAANIARQAEVLAGFGYLDEAVETNADACRLDPKDINLQIKQVDLLSQAEKHDEALKQLAVVQKLAANDEEREAWLQRELKELQALEKLKDRIAAARAELHDLKPAGTDKEKLAQSDKWLWLARAYEAERQLKEAAEAAGRAAALAPQSIPILMASARILESQNNLLAAIEANTRLAAIDRRYRTEYLKKIAQLEIQLGRREKAIQAGRDLLAAAPGNPEHYEFFSQLCFQLGENEEGLQALRRSVRVNPTEPKGLLLLASALGEQFRTGEAIELYWRAFEKAGNLDDRLSVVPRLTELYLQTNQFDRLLERLERQRREPNQQREMTICLAQAYQSAGDDGNARQELEKLLTEETRDTQLLQQLVKLCEQDGDLEAAIRFQQLMNKAAPGKEGTFRLAQLLMKAGERDEGLAMLNQATAEEKDPEQLLRSIDSLLSQKNFEQVQAITEKLVRDQPKNWELLYRDGVALASTKPEEAAKRFQSILALNIKDDEEAQAAKNLAKKNQGRSRSPVVQFREQNPFVQRAQYSWQIRQAAGLDSENYYGGGYGQQQPFWAPHDFGTMRMACIAWLNAIARNAGKEDQFLQQRNAELEKSTDRRVIIDGVYLAALRHDSKQQYEIIKKLSYLPDADVGIKSMYLSSLSGRGGPQSRRVVNEDTGESELTLEPLDKDELEHVLACYKAIGDSTSMINFGETFLELVAGELKRAGRTEEAARMLDEAIASAKSSMQIAAILPGTIQRGDFETAMKLLDRLAEVKSEAPVAQGSVFNYAQYISSPDYQAQILGQLMGNRAQKKELKDVLALWDRYLRLAVARYDAEKATPATNRKRNSANQQYSSPGYYQIWRGGNQRGEQLDFPTANAFYNHSSILLLRQTYVAFKEADALKDLVEHFQSQIKDQQLSGTKQIFWKLGLGYLFWWNDDKDDALALLSDVAASLPDDEDMTFELARLHEKRGDAKLALELLESLSPSDQQMMQKREISALRLSVNSGNIERARTAAERLFGLRLDSNLQIQLARQMHQLAMHEQAEAVLARAGRQAGNKTDVLMNLMQQYQSQGKNDVATQIAHQLLRRSPGSSAQYAMSGMMRSSRDDNGARQQALQVLKRSGKLPELITKVEEQLKHSPKSQKLIETLIEYYTAAGNEKKVSELSERYAETKGDDPQFRYQLGMKLMQAGKHKESLEHFKVALKKEPRLLRNSYWEIQNAFENADKLDDLAALYEEIDLKSFRQNPYELTNLISNMSRREKTKNRSITLFKKAWQDLPDQRSQLLSNLNGDVFWKMPEIYDYARQGIIPTETSLRQTGNWAGFGNIQSWDENGKMTTLLNRFLTIATQTKRLDELATEVEQAREKLKTWQAGEPLLALINLRRGRVDESRAVFEKLLPTMKGIQNVGYYTHWEIAQELAAKESCVDLATKYLEMAVKEPELMSGNEFPYTPAKLLVNLYKQRGRKDDARRLVLQAINTKRDRNYGNQQYEAYQRVRNAISLANELRALDYPVDAIRLYQDTLSRTDDLTAAQQWGNNSKKELQDGFQAALKAIKPESLPELLLGSPDAAGKQPTSVDLVLLLDSRELDKTTMTSALVNLVRELVNKPDMLTKTRQALVDVQSQRPNDVSALIIATELAFATRDEDSKSSLVASLIAAVDREPLEPQPAKGGFTAQQRDVARQQAALWLVARECLKHESLRDKGVQLADRALEASRRQTDNGYTLAILREWGQIALDAGDREGAEKRWSEMLEVIIPVPAEKGKTPTDKKTSQRDTRPVFRPLTRWELMVAPAIAGQVGTTGSVLSIIAPGPAATVSPNGNSGNIITLAQFEQVAQIAKLAAQHGMTDLSIRSMAKALHSGPPIEPIQANEASASGFPVVAQPQSSDQSPILQKVEERLTAMEQMWRKKGVDSQTIYQVVKKVVLPDSRPLEVFIYPRPLARNPNQTPQSIGLLLVQTAVRAKQIDDLKAALAPRLQQPLGELPARILMTQLALAAKDTAAAKSQIEALSQRLKQDSLQYSSELACHVAIPAMTLPELPPAAVSLFERAVDHFNQNAQQGRSASQEEPMRTFRFQLARFHFQNGDAAAGKKHLEDYLAFLVPLYRRYGGDYGQYRRRLELIKIAAEYARAGIQTDALDCLGQYADLPLSRNYGQEGLGRAGAMILQGLTAIPAVERYDLLKTWSLPTADRQSVRAVSGLIPGDRAPEDFDSLRGATPRGPHDVQLLSTLEILVDAATQAGKLEELRSQLQPHVDKDVENAKVLMLLVRIAQRDKEVAKALGEYQAERNKAVPSQSDYQKRPQLLDAVVARTAMRTPEFNETGRQMGITFFTHSSRVQEHLLMTMMRHDYNSSVVGYELAHHIDQDQSRPGLMHWTAGAVTPARTDAAGAIPMWWIGDDGIISHICGPHQSYLFLKYPLTGSYEISCEGYLGAWGEPNIGVNGLVFQGLNLGSDTTIFPLGNTSDAIHKPDPLERQDHYNRLRLKVEPDKTQYYVNGYLIHSEPTVEATSPWFMLQCSRVWQTAFRNFEIKGQPIVPRQVQLSSKDSLLGWSAEFYNESIPPRKVVVHDAPQENTPEYDWWAADGVIQSRLLPTTGFGKPPVQQSRLFYGRPLLNGERLRYEFWHEAGTDGCHVDPAFDRLTFLLRDDGVRIHWMTDGDTADEAYGGLPTDHGLLEKSIQRSKVELKDQDWNAVEIELKNDIVTITLNGATICERPLELDNSRQFGFYHDKNATSVKVRNVVLTGDWPMSLSPEIIAGLTAPATQLNDAARRQLRATIEEKYRATDIDRLLLQARSLPLPARYEMLKDWVLPNNRHDTFRMTGDVAPADPLAVTPIMITPVSLAGATSGQAGSGAVAKGNDKAATRRRSGGELIAPALDLIATARELGKLDELAELVRQVPEVPDQVKRSRQAMLVLISIASNDLKTGEKELKSLTPSRAQGLPDSLPAAERWPELIAAWEAARVPELRRASVDLLEVVLDSVNRKGVGHDWDVKARSARQHGRVLLERDLHLPAASAVSPKGQWAQSTLVKASSRGNGMVPRWHFSGAETLHLGGEGNDLIYFQSPLRGTFTVEAELSAFGWREARLMYDAAWAAPNYNHEAADLGNLYTNWVGPKFATKMDQIGDWYSVKMEVTPDKVTYHANDRLIHEHPLQNNPDPWLALHSFGNYAGASRMIRITGQPEIPAELKLSAREDLVGWWADMYGDPMNGDNAFWKKAGDEIVGARLPNWEGRSRESLLQYHRPMLEDGEIDYDYFYVPKQTDVSPALGRMAMMLTGEGVKVHWLTDAQFERGGLAPDNLFVEQEYRRGPAALPLKANDWNHVSLSLKGDLLTLSLNGEVVYQRPVDPDNLRTFGLFKFAGESEARVKSVVYRGNWPRSLPSINEQELAGSDAELASFKEGDLPAQFTWNLRDPMPGNFHRTGDLPTTKRAIDADGVRIARAPSSDPQSQAAGYQWSGMEIGGDFEVILGYRDFDASTGVATPQAPRVEIVLALGGPFGKHSHSLSLTHRRQADGKMSRSAIQGVRRMPPEEDWQVTETPTTATGGRIRIVRRDRIVYFQAAPPGSNDWITIDRRPASTADINDLLIGLRSEDLAATTSVVLTEFSVRAKRLAYIPRLTEDNLTPPFVWNFKGTMPKSIQKWGTEAPNKFETNDAGTRVSRPAGPEQRAVPVGFNWMGKLKGDFEVTLGYRDFESNTDVTDWRLPRIEIHIPIAATDGSSTNTHIATVGHRRRANATMAVNCGLAYRQPDGQLSWKTSEKPADYNSGRLRLIRIGQTIHALVAPAGSDQFISLGSHLASDADIGSISLTIRSEGENSSAAVTFSELSIRAVELNASNDADAATRIPGPVPFGGNALPVQLSWNFQGQRPAFLEDWSKPRKNTLTPVPEGMKLVRSASVDDSEQGIGYSFAGGLAGDFEVTLDYRDFTSTPILTDWRVPRVDMSGWIFASDDPQKLLVALGICHRRDRNESIRLLGTQGVRNAEGKYTYKTIDTATARDSGRLRLVRQGSTMFYQAAPSGSEEWQTICRMEAAPGPFKGLSLGIRAEDLEAGGQAVFTNINIRAAELLKK